MHLNKTYAPKKMAPAIKNMAPQFKTYVCTRKHRAPPFKEQRNTCIQKNKCIQKIAVSKTRNDLNSVIHYAPPHARACTKHTQLGGGNSTKKKISNKKQMVSFKPWRSVLFQCWCHGFFQILAPCFCLSASVFYMQKYSGPVFGRKYLDGNSGPDTGNFIFNIRRLILKLFAAT